MRTPRLGPSATARAVSPANTPNGITEAEADALLRQHLAETESYIDSAMSSLGVTLNQHQYDALASLTYNIGVGWFHSGYRLQHALRGYTVLHR